MCGEHDREAKAASHWAVEWESGLYAGGAAVGSCSTTARAGPPAPLQLNGLVDAAVKVKRAEADTLVDEIEEKEEAHEELRERDEPRENPLDGTSVADEKTEAGDGERNAILLEFNPRFFFLSIFFFGRFSLRDFLSTDYWRQYFPFLSYAAQKK